MGRELRLRLRRDVYTDLNPELYLDLNPWLHRALFETSFQKSFQKPFVPLFGAIFRNKLRWLKGLAYLASRRQTLPGGQSLGRLLHGN